MYRMWLGKYLPHSACCCHPSLHPILLKPMPNSPNHPKQAPLSSSSTTTSRIGCVGSCIGAWGSDTRLLVTTFKIYTWSAAVCVMSVAVTGLIITSASIYEVCLLRQLDCTLRDHVQETSSNPVHDDTDWVRAPSETQRPPTSVQIPHSSGTPL